MQAGEAATQAVTGLDVIELMLRSAAGERLSVSQERASHVCGAAIGCRVYCEQPEMEFLP